MYQALRTTLIVYGVTVLTFVLLMRLMWSLSPANFHYALELGLLWGAPGSLAIGLLHFASGSSKVSLIFGTAWWLAGSFLYLGHIARSA
ncbi:MAG: hypothetical protein QM775_05065 [Pirellulales bacterium]